MRIKRFLLRYYPPEYKQGDNVRTRPIELPYLDYQTDSGRLAKNVVKNEPLVRKKRTAQIEELIERLKCKASVPDKKQFTEVKMIKAHDLPLTNVSFNKTGSHFITGSYDRTCKIWDAATGEEVRILDGHTNVVYTVAFNLPVSALWDYRTGRRVRHLSGHSAEVAAAACSFDGRFVATASMDKTLRVWDTRKGAELAILRGHVDEVLDVSFDLSGRQLASASADATAILWSTDQADDIHKFKKLRGHEGEVSKVCFSPRGHTLMTASADKSVRLWDTLTGELRDVLVGHSDEVFSCAFNYDGDTIITGSKDNTCRIWQ